MWLLMECYKTYSLFILQLVNVIFGTKCQAISSRPTKARFTQFHFIYYFHRIKFRNFANHNLKYICHFYCSYHKKYRTLRISHSCLKQGEAAWRCCMSDAKVNSSRAVKKSRVRSFLIIFNFYISQIFVF